VQYTHRDVVRRTQTQVTYANPLQEDISSHIMYAVSVISAAKEDRRVQVVALNEVSA